MFYFFSDSNSNIKQVLKNEVVDFRITANDEWSDPIAQCQTTAFSSFDLENKNVRIKTTLNFFLPKREVDAGQEKGKGNAETNNPRFNFFKCLV